MNKDSKYECIQHAGVMGMKWGVRKRSVKTSTNPRPTDKRMTNNELKSRIARLKLETEYTKLIASPPQVSKVEKLVKHSKTVAELSGSALSIYKNLNEVSKLVSSKGA